MDKYKIYTLNTKLSLYQLKEMILENTTQDENTYDFELLKYSPKSISFKFSEKKILETSLLDKNGKEQVIEYLHIDSFNFQIIEDTNSFYLLLINPTRSLKFFKNTLSEILDYSIGLSDINLDPLEWLENIEKNSNERFQILSIEIKDIIFDSKTNGSMIFKSTLDLRTTYKEFLNIKNYKVSKVLLNNNDFYRGKFILSKDASFQIESLNSNKFLEVLIKSL
ncbi:hypothetical protein RZ571_001491 [Acinetobacter baumannii]|uniref:hypothetical protein n=1 Tax=Acinetobacter baumannii TaxID=470 RepID=UPI0007107DCD|nr:hypothetical protein [Acinetobacter baumannii]EKU7085446.1 hypothetical protein [Acinetobacter baumannii]EKV1042111.1 hypothetical protein [Acinetobacter baumannii]EKV3704436.1 hypothetical protein [Acinetobacter baumannii]EKV3733574.1 hypothetical protein [Acinetobacter baumannii]EKV3809953.1 hypothetical protein [Acinetobacter baumannii]